jgi:ligand-binding sensor domain-containing protein
MNFERWLSLLISFGSLFCYSQPLLTIYNQQNSDLPFNTVRCIAIQNNIKWFGTDNGLASFDGLNWQVYDTTNTPLLDNDIRALKVQNDSILWIGTMQGGVYKKTNNQWINYNEWNSGLHDNLVRAIEIDSSGYLWLATSEGVSMFDGQNWSLWNIANNGLLTNNITSIKTGFYNEKYVGTINGGLLYFDDLNNLTMHSIVESGLPDNSSLAIDIDENGQPWFATPAAGLVTDLSNGGPWERFNMSNSPIPTNGLTCLAIDQSDQRIFTGTELFGIIIKKNDIWFTYNQDNIGLPDNYITSIAHESNQVKWIGTFNHGVVRLEENSSNSLNNFQLQRFSCYPTILSQGESIFTKGITPYVASIKIINQFGETIFQHKLEMDSFQFPDYIPSGMYQMIIQENEFAQIHKLVIR